MSIYISNIEIPKEPFVSITLRYDGSVHVWSSYKGEGFETKAIPAADVRPVVKAHWYWDKDGMDWGIGSWRCSACHSRPETWWQGDSTNPRNKSGHYFCPNCGAKMEEI